ncbi:hypothetical protein BTO07_09565 [Polaribacter sp. SA4-12]|nr:hypothetical protein BTO07_09565 [Polaribacter sp. SA4-12]
MNVILNSENIEIQVNVYGGLPGYSEYNLFVKKNDFESLIIIDKGTDYQTFVTIRDDRKLLNEFFMKSVETNNPEKQYRSSCIGPNNYEYIFKSGMTKLKVKPSRECDSIFSIIMKEKF